MAIFQLANCDVGFSYKGVNYDFEDIETVTITDPEKVHITRGMSSRSTKGIVYNQNAKDPKTVSFTIMGISGDYFNLFTKIFEAKDRLDAYVIDRKTGTMRLFKDAVLQQRVRQTAINDKADSFAIQIVLECFKIEEKHKE